MSAGVMLADALVVDVAGDDLGAEGDRGDDRRLGAGVEALDVGGRVALGEAEALGLGERVAVVGALLGHLREDVVGRAVDDADHAADRLAAQALAQRRARAGCRRRRPPRRAGRRRASSAAANSSTPTLASSSLFAVTTGLPPRERGR